MINNNVVVYEPSKDTYPAIKKTVDAEGYSTYLAFDEAQFLQLIAQLDPWLVIVAINAPGLIPLQPVCEKVPSKRASVLTLTASVNAPPGYPDASDMYLTKPFYPPDLTLIIRRLRWGWEQNGQAEISGSHQEQGSALPSNIVVVYEEDPAAQQAVKKCLESESYAVLPAFCPDEAFTLINTHRPWLLVLGEGPLLPDASKFIEQLPDHRPEVLLLIEREPWMRGDYMMPSRGASMVLIKPFNQQELKQFVQRLRAGWEESH